MSWNELLALITIIAMTAGILLDVGIRVISYTRSRQKDFYTLSNKVALLEQDFREFENRRNQVLLELRDVQGIVRKAGLYKRDTDQTIGKSEI